LTTTKILTITNSEGAKITTTINSTAATTTATSTTTKSFF